MQMDNIFGSNQYSSIEGQRMLITLSLKKACFAFSMQLNVVQEPGVGSSSIGWIINAAQPAFHFNPDLTVSSPVPSGHFDTACHQYSVLFTSRWLGVLAFEGSSHCLGWPVLMLYRKRPQASVNWILVDDNGTVIYRGCRFYPTYAERYRGEDGYGGESESSPSLFEPVSF